MTTNRRFPVFGRGAWVVCRRNYLAWVKYYKTSLVLNFGEPLTNLLAMGFGLGAYISQMDGVSFAEFIGPGLLAVTAMNAVTFDMTFEGFSRIHENGVYHAMIAAPLTAADIVAGEYLWEAGRSLLYGMVFLAVLAAMGLVRSWWALLVPIPLVVAGVLFAAPALWVATNAKNFEQLFYYLSLVVMPMFLFSGVFFPVTHLPWSVRELIYLLPLYHVVFVLRGLVLGQVGMATVVHFGYLVAYAGALAVLPVRSLGRRLGD